MAEKKEKKIISANDGKEIAASEAKDAKIKPAKPVGNSTGYRIGAVVLWVVAIVFSYFTKSLDFKRYTMYHTCSKVYILTQMCIKQYVFKNIASCKQYTVSILYSHDDLKTRCVVWV